MPEAPRLRERPQGRLRKARLPAPSSSVRSAAARPTRELWQRSPRPRTCYGCIPERPSVEDQGQRAGAAHRGPAEQQQRQQQQPVARLPHHGHAPPPRITLTKPTAAAPPYFRGWGTRNSRSRRPAHLPAQSAPPDPLGRGPGASTLARLGLLLGIAGGLRAPWAPGVHATVLLKSTEIFFFLLLNRKLV